ncbi:hypothetical protein BCV70DRAFT_117538 [Testicularia cyperi]|uniref:Uncharacterized protein n=1 Tax=Testicularia cyperi TaxID=1882483 RepID=A0A317XM43_9BASI|nr:hypothetical protein BCV70DRAFT_117538 [Testicularia cyperi]
MLAKALAPLAMLNGRMMQPVHPTLYPFPLATTLHALRVALAYRAICSGFRARRKAEGKTAQELHVSRLRDAAGFLVMAWGGGFIANYLLCQIPGQMLTVWPWINYLSVYGAVTLALSVVGSGPSAKLLDLALPVIDGATRTAATYGGINLVLNHANPAARSSLLLQIIIGTISACGGGISAFTLNVFDPLGWSFATPPFLKAKSLVEFTDIIAPALATAVFGVTTLSHPNYAPVVAAIHTKQAAILSQEGGKAIISLVIASCFYLRAVWLHILVPAASPAPAPAPAPAAPRPIASNKAVRAAAKKQ